MKLRINGRGHYVVSLFCFGGVSDCLAVEGNSHRKNHERSFANSEVEKSERLGVSDSVETRDLAEPCNADVHWQSSGNGRDHDCADDEPDGKCAGEDGGWRDQSQRPGSSCRSTTRWNEESNPQPGSAEGREVCKAEEPTDHGGNVCQRQGVHELGQESYHGDLCSGHATVPSVHLPSRSRETGPNQERNQEEANHGDSRATDAGELQQSCGQRQDCVEEYEVSPSTRGQWINANGVAVSRSGKRVRDGQPH